MIPEAKEKFCKLTGWQDKTCHTVLLGLYVLVVSYIIGLGWAVFTAGLIGTAVEVYDVRRKKKLDPTAKFDWPDMKADGVGILVGTVVYLLLRYTF